MKKFLTIMAIMPFLFWLMGCGETNVDFCDEVIEAGDVDGGEADDDDDNDDTADKDDDDNDDSADDDDDNDDNNEVDHGEVGDKILAQCFAEGWDEMEFYSDAAGKWGRIGESSYIGELEAELHPGSAKEFRANVRLSGDDNLWMCANLEDEPENRQRGYCDFFIIKTDIDGKITDYVKLEAVIEANSEDGSNYLVTIKED